MSEIKPVYQWRHSSRGVLPYSWWQDCTEADFNVRGNKSQFNSRILYPAAAYEALQADHAENCALLKDALEENTALQKESDELRLMINGSVLQIQAMQLQINAMKIGQKVLDGSIQAKSISDSEWREKYMREVEGLNNEGDPIGGDPPSGLRHSVEYLKSENAAQEKRIAELEAESAKDHTTILRLKDALSAYGDPDIFADDED